MVFIGAVGHFVLIVACVAAFHQLRPGKKEWLQCVAGAVLVLAYFALIAKIMIPPGQR